MAKKKEEILKESRLIKKLKELEQKRDEIEITFFESHSVSNILIEPDLLIGRYRDALRESCHCRYGGEEIECGKDASYMHYFGMSKDKEPLKIEPLYEKCRVRQIVDIFLQGYDDGNK